MHADDRVAHPRDRLAAERAGTGLVALLAAQDLNQEVGVAAAVDERDPFLLAQRVTHVADCIEPALFLRRVLAAGPCRRVDERADGGLLVRSLRRRRREYRQKHRYA